MHTNLEIPALGLPTQDAMLDQAFAQRRSSVPARQMGMARDCLVAALFGPAGEQRA